MFSAQVSMFLLKLASVYKTVQRYHSEDQRPRRHGCEDASCATADWCIKKGLRDCGNEPVVLGCVGWGMWPRWVRTQGMCAQFWLENIYLFYILFKLILVNSISLYGHEICAN
jgi:hypothetical protein